MSKTHKQWMRECIEECKTCGNLNTASGAERLIEKFAEHMDESPSGGVTSWNDLQDRPFYEETNVITWDGNKDGLVHVLFDHPTSGDDWGDYSFYKVSDAIPNVKTGDTVTVLDSDGDSLGSCELAQENENILTTTTGNREFVIVLSDNADYSFTFYADYAGTFPEKGVYFRDVLDSTGGIRPRTGSVDFGSIVHRIDPKFIPSSEKIAIYIEGLNGKWIVTCDKTAEEVYARVKADPINTEIIGVFKPNMSAGSFDYVEGVVSKPLSVTATENSLLLYFRPLSISGGESLVPADVMVGVMDGEFAVVLLS